MFHPEPFVFSAEPGQVVRVDARYELFVVQSEEWDAAPDNREHWCNKHGTRPAGWVLDPLNLSTPPMYHSCVDRQPARLLDAQLIPEGTTPGNADGYQARFEILGKGDFCRVCGGHSYKACSVISVQ